MILTLEKRYSLLHWINRRLLLTCCKDQFKIIGFSPNEVSSPNKSISLKKRMSQFSSKSTSGGIKLNFNEGMLRSDILYSSIPFTKFVIQTACTMIHDGKNFIALGGKSSVNFFHQEFLFLQS